MPTIVVLGTLDTKGEEHQFLADQLRRLGADVIVVDAGIDEPSFAPDVPQAEVAHAADASVALLRSAGDRNAAVDAMGRGAGIVLGRLFEAGRLHGVVTLGGGGGTTLASTAFSALPVGVPKLIVSTIAAGDMRPYVKGSDVTFTYAVLDIAGLNPITTRIIGNAAGAIAGMSTAYQQGLLDDTARDAGRPLVAITAFGVTSGAVGVARNLLAEAGYESLVFHAVGSGGESLEALVRAGFFAGVLDLTTTELVDDLVGGVMSAGPGRLTAAAVTGTPQVVSVGAMDMVNLGPLESIRPEFRQRQLIQHNPQMTLMRTLPEENAELGRRLAAKLNEAAGPAAVFLPLAGVSSVAVEGAPFRDAVADKELFDAIRSNLAEHVELEELDVDINNENFAGAMVARLVSYLESATEGSA